MSDNQGGGPQMKGISWPQAAIILTIIAAVVLLAILKRDIASFVALGVAILGAIGLGVGQINVVKQIVNGNLSRILDMLEKRDQQTQEHMRLLAAAHVPAAALQQAIDTAPPAGEIAPPAPSAGGAAG